MLDGYEITAQLDVVCQQIDYWHYGELSPEDRTELEATKAELIAEAKHRLYWLWENMPDDDTARDSELSAEIDEVTHYLRAIGELEE